MRDRKVAIRYAEALLLTAKPAGVLAGCAESYAGVLNAVAGNRDLATFLQSPQVATQEKKELLRKVFGSHIEPLLLDFFNMLLDRNRLESVRDIGEVFAELVEADNNITRARVVTAVVLPEDLEKRLRVKLESVTGKSVILEKKVDPAVIGGVCVTLGDRILDGTVRTNLDLLRKTLANAQVRG
jgi:F-type H+-transporting ATPase subunit delta